MRIGVPRESLPGENRAAATPRTVTALQELGYDVVVEYGAGDGSSASDAAFQAAGARVADARTVWSSDIVLGVNEPDEQQLSLMRRGAVLITFLHPRQTPELTERLAAQGITAMSMDMVPRTSRAQALDALSSMANISGYRAVVEASHSFGRFFTGQVTAAGKVPPAKVLVAGTGVAGLMLGAEVLQTAILETTLPVLGDVKLVTSLFFDMGVYLIVVGLVLDILRSLGAELDRQEDEEDPIEAVPGEVIVR